MLNYISLQEVNNKALVCVEDKLKREIISLRRMLIQEEKKLYCVAIESLAIEESIKRFYSTYYMKRLGVYISILEDLKNRFWSIKTKNNEEKRDDKELECDEIELKKIYRKLAKIYHPDKYGDLSEEEKEFFELRMSEANKYFERKDIKSLKNMLEQAEIELSDEMPSLKRIEFLKMRISVIKDLKKIYEKKKEALKEEDMYKLMNMPENEREIEIEKRKEIIISDIKVYMSLLEPQKNSQKC